MHGVPLLVLLLVLSCLMLAGMGFGGLMVSRALEQRQKRDARLAVAVSPHIRVRALEVSAFTPPPVSSDRSALGLIAWVFRFNRAKADQYPLKWWMVLCITLAMAYVVYLFAAGLLGSMAPLVIPSVWVVLSRGYFGWVEGRRTDKLFQQFPEALTMIVRSVRVGIPVMEGMRMVAREAPQPTQLEFVRMVEQISVGVTLEDATLDMARRTGLPEYRFFATTLALQNQTGGALSETLEGLADVVRKRVALKARGHALASEAKMSATILASLPVVLGLALLVLNPRYMAVFVTDPTGHKVLTGAVLSLGTGIMVMRTMIRRSLS